MSSRQVTWDDFAAYLRAIRASRNLSQRDLGAQLGCGQIHVWRLEHGQRHPSRALLLLLKRDFLLRPEDSVQFDAFRSMLVYQCDCVDLEDLRAVGGSSKSAAGRSMT